MPCHRSTSCTPRELHAPSTAPWGLGAPAAAVACGIVRGRVGAVHLLIAATTILEKGVRLRTIGCQIILHLGYEGKKLLLGGSRLLGLVLLRLGLQS